MDIIGTVVKEDTMVKGPNMVITQVSLEIGVIEV